MENLVPYLIQIWNFPLFMRFQKIQLIFKWKMELQSNKKGTFERG